jgi:integrase
MKRRTGYLFKRGSNFYVSWKVNGKLFMKALRDDNGQPITAKREAEIARDKFMLPIATGDEAAVLESIAGKLEGRKAEIAKWENEKNPPLSIGQAWSEFLASPNRPDSGKSTLRQYEFQWQAFADWMKEKHADALTLRDVTKEIAEEYASSLNHGRFSPSTYNKHLNLLTLVFRVVKHKAKLTGNPWESPKRGGNLQRKRMITNSRRELTIDELRKICQTATGELQTLLALGIYSGLRLGDCATLRWGEVDLPRVMIRRIPNKTARRNPKPVIVPIHPILRDMLAATPLDQRREYVLPEMAALYIHRTDMVTDMVQKHFKACGITLHRPGTGKDGKRAVIEVGFHSLRHTFVSLCRESNAPLSVVESIVGHSSPAMTRHYTHVGELAAGRAVALLPSVMSEATPEPTKRGQDEILREVQTILKNMSAKNWREKKSAALAMLAAD